MATSDGTLSGIAGPNADRAGVMISRAGCHATYLSDCASAVSRWRIFGVMLRGPFWRRVADSLLRAWFCLQGTDDMAPEMIISGAIGDGSTRYQRVVPSMTPCSAAPSACAGSFLASAREQLDVISSRDGHGAHWTLLDRPLPGQMRLPPAHAGQIRSGGQLIQKPMDAVTQTILDIARLANLRTWTAKRPCPSLRCDGPWLDLPRPR
jgi:hypothetical protein